MLADEKIKEMTLMRINKLVGVSTLSLFLGTSALMYAQEEKTKEESRPAESQKDKASPAPNRQNDTARPQESREQTGKIPEQSEDKNVRGEERSRQDAGQGSTQQDSKQMDRNEHNSQMNGSRQDQAQHAQAGGNRGGGHIPDEKFRSSFGRQHTFVVNRPASGGQPQFQYGGYTFNIIDAWPADWSYSDQVYVDYVDGQYFLYDMAHPGVTVAIAVVM